MIEVSNADRIVFPALGRTKGDLVAYYDRIAPKALAHVRDRLLSIRRYPKGLAGAGFFQKNVPAHYPESIRRVAVPRSKAATKKHRDKAEQNVTLYPVIDRPEQLAYLANQGAIELHVPTACVTQPHRPDRFVIDLDPPPDAFDKVRSAARLTRKTLQEFGLEAVPIATGSKGYHVVAPIEATLDAEQIALTAQKFASLLAARYPEQLTLQYRIALRGERVFVDWLRNNPMATVVAPYSLRATAKASVATPLSWAELEHTDPDAFSLDDVERLLERSDPLLQLAAAPGPTQTFVANVDAAFEHAGLELETFDRFRAT